jgi:predicted  nucleic acid-binding Zn-ribbon protein
MCWETYQPPPPLFSHWSKPLKENKDQLKEEKDKAKSDLDKVQKENVVLEEECTKLRSQLSEAESKIQVLTDHQLGEIRLNRFVRKNWGLGIFLYFI